LTWGTNIRGERERPGLPGGDPPLPPTTPTEHARCTWLDPPLPYGGKPRSDDRTDESPSPPPSSTSAPSPYAAATSSSRPLALPMSAPRLPLPPPAAAKRRRNYGDATRVGLVPLGRGKKRAKGLWGRINRNSLFLVIKRVPLTVPGTGSVVHVGLASLRCGTHIVCLVVGARGPGVGNLCVGDLERSRIPARTLAGRDFGSGAGSWFCIV
jgi:hypothetical protein